MSGEGEFPFRTIAIAGLGLIGGSFALAVREARAAQTLIGLDLSPEHRAQAVELGLVDRVLESFSALPSETDLLLLAVPVASFPQVLQELAPHLSSDTILTDAGSVKGPLVEWMRRPDYAGIRFVPGHPIAGGERFGPQAAKSGLFRDKRFILTPTTETDPEALQKVRSLWESFGAEVQEMEAQTHDEIFAAVSHLPHLLAYASIQAIVSSDHPEALSHSGAGLKDFSRIASSSPDMWSDIFLENQAPLLQRVSVFRETLDALEAAIRAGDRDTLRKLLLEAKEARDRWVR